MNSTKNKIYVTSEYVDIGTIFDDEMHDIAAYRDRIVSELNRIQERVQSESLYVDLEVTDIPHCDTLRISLYREETDKEFEDRLAKEKEINRIRLEKNKKLEEAFGSPEYQKYLEHKDKFQEFLRFMEKVK